MSHVNPTLAEPHTLRLRGSRCLELVLGVRAGAAQEGGMVTTVGQAGVRMLGSGEGSETVCSFLILSPSSVRIGSEVNLLASPPWGLAGHPALPQVGDRAHPPKPPPQPVLQWDLPTHTQGTTPHQSPTWALAPSLGGC